MMLVMGLSHPDIEVIGISTVFGNATIENTTNNALAILKLANRTDIDVYKGCSKPL